MSRPKRKAKLYNSVRSRLGIIKTDLRSGNPLGFIKKLRMWGIGFLGDKYIAYNLDRNNRKDYLTDFQGVMARFINELYSEILNNKML